jgi:uncharacterized protein (DUF3084 family)
MSTPISDAGALYARLEEVLGHEHADTLMTYLPAEPGARMATRSDVAVLERRFDRLEELLGARFDAIDGRFHLVDQRFEQVDQRFEQVDQRFEQVDQRFEQVDQRFDRMDRRFETMDDRMYGLQDVIRDQLRTYTVTMIGGMTALAAIFAALLAFIA